MTEFFCIKCADRSDEAESLSLGCLGVHQCVVCGRKVDCQTEGAVIGVCKLGQYYA